MTVAHTKSHLIQYPVYTEDKAMNLGKNGQSGK